MNINSNNLLEIAPGDTWQLENRASPNSRPGLVPRQVALTITDFLRIEDAIQAYLRPQAASYHLLLGRDGRRLVQLLPFDQQARCTGGFDPHTLTIALDYTTKTGMGEDIQLRETITSIAGNYRPVKFPTFPPEQLDGLVEILLTLQAHFHLPTILPISETYAPGPQLGPAFPLARLQERVFEGSQGATLGRMALDEVVSPASLHDAPDPAAPAATAQLLPAGTPVFIVEDWKNWVRVEVLQEIEGNPWRVGWVAADRVQAVDYEMEVRGDRLESLEGRRYRFFPAAKRNYDTKKVLPKEDIHFVVMHITTGPHLDATLNTFQNPAEGVSAHFVVARDGRVIQMVPLDRAAFHAGGGLWENQGGFNYHSIGIEVDNAGKLSESGERVYARRGNLTIPPGRYQREKHWRDYYEKPWEDFPDIQLKTTFQLVKALERHFRPIQEVLEHERISLLTRTDPGPLFPMNRLRLEVLGRSEPVFERYRLVRASTLFQNSYFQAPKKTYLQFPAPKSQCQVNVIFTESNYWCKVEIVKYQTKKWHGRKGWVLKRDIFNKDGKTYLTPKRDFYQDPDDKLEPPCLPLVPLPAGTEVRIQKTGKNRWCLVATPDHQPGFKFLEGWLRLDDLERIEEG